MLFIIKYDMTHSIEEQDMVPKHDEVPDIAQIHNESEEQNHLDKSDIVYDNE